MGCQLDAEEIAELTVEVSQSALRSGQHPDLDITQTLEPSFEQSQSDRLAGSGIAGDQSEAAFAGEVLDPPTEAVECRRRAQPLDGHLR